MWFMHYTVNGRLSQVDSILGYSKVRYRYTTFMQLNKNVALFY